jgi:hypothetical protein
MVDRYTLGALDEGTFWGKQMDADRFSKVASGVQSVVTSIGIIAAGVWAFTTFWVLGSTQKSSADLEKARAEIAEIDQRVAEHTVLAIEITKCDASGDLKDSKRPIAVCASFRNDGKEPLKFKDTVLEIAKLPGDSGELDPKGRVLSVKPKWIDNGQFSVMPERQFDFGMARRLVFLVPPLDPGSYFLQVKTEFIGLIRRSDGTSIESPDGWGLAIEQSAMIVPNAGQQ